MHAHSFPNRLHWLSITVIGVLAGHFFLIVHLYAVNVPYFDDFKVISFIDEVRRSPFENFHALFQNFNGHRFGFPFLMMALDSMVEGSYNLRSMMFLGAAFYTGFFLFLYKSMRSMGLRASAMVPVALLMFQPSVHRNIFWPISTLQYMTSVLLSIGMFHYLGKDGQKSFLKALFLAALHPVTNGNGLYVIALALPQLVYMRCYRKALCWAAFVLVYAWFFYQGMPTVIGLNGYNHQSHDLVANPSKIFGCFLSFLGASVYAFRLKSWDAVAAGAIIVTITIIVAARMLYDYYRRKPGAGISHAERAKVTILLTAISMVLTAAGAAISRGNAGDFMIIDRYEVYSVLSIALLYSLSVASIPASYQRQASLAAIPFALIFSLFMHWQYLPAVAQWKDSLLTDVYMLRRNRTVQGKLYPFPVGGYEQFQSAVKNGTYRFPSTLLDQLDTIPDHRFNKHNAKSGVSFHFTHHLLNHYGGIHYYQISSDSIPANSQERKFIILESINGKKTFVLAPEWHRNLGYRAFFQMKSPYKPGLTVNAYQDTVEPGRYHIGILTFHDSVPEAVFSDQLFNMPSEGQLTLFSQKPEIPEESAN